MKRTNRLNLNRVCLNGFIEFPECLLETELSGGLKGEKKSDKILTVEKLRNLIRETNYIDIAK